MTVLEQARRILRKPPAEIRRRLAHELATEADRFRAGARARRLDEPGLLSRTGSASLAELWDACVERAPFPPAPGLTVAASERERILAAAAAAAEHTVDVLGSGPVALGASPSWSRDPRSGRVWPRGYAPRLSYVDLRDSSDVKLPWEISRLQWLLPLGQAYALTGDERHAAAARDVLLDWIDHNPYGGSVNWAVTTEVALRSISFAWLLGALGRSRAWSEAPFRLAFLRTLWLHGEYTQRHLERSNVNGNHFVANAVGLVFAGSVLGEDAWSGPGWEMLLEELPRQVFPDGVDFEASSAYHRLVCELIALAALYRRRLAQDVPAWATERLQAMGRFTRAATGPDGLAPLWGDADDARALPLDGSPPRDHRHLLGLLGLARDAPGSAWLPSLPAATSDADPRAFPYAGAFVLAGDGDHVFVDCGPVGLAGRGGHGHNDALSFECVLDGVRLVTDSGCLVYTASRELRNRYRATAAHNTPVVDGEEQNRIPESLWELHDDARAEALLVEQLRLRGTHHGYERLRDPVRVVRELELDPHRHRLVVTDELEAREPHDVRVPIHLAEGVHVAERAEGRLLLDAGGRRFALTWSPAGDWACELAAGAYAPSYGVEREIVRIELRRDGDVRPLRVVLEPA